MVPALAPIREGSSILEAKRLMAEKASDILLVVDDRGTFRGAIRFEQVNQKDGGTVAESMDPGIPTARDDGEIRETLERMLREERLWLPIVDEEKCLKGIVTMTQFASFFAREAQG
jgi:Mg/Co/Ni transporter MgtE